MSSIELFNLFVSHQAKPKRQEECRRLGIEFMWKKKNLIYLSAHRGRSVFVNYLPEGIEIRYQANATTQSADLWILKYKEDERGLITAAGDEFPEHEASERLWNSILRWFGTGG